jgi:hypothetical protein
MDREPTGGSDYGRDIARDLGDEPPGALRDAPPDYFKPIDESAPVSGHVPPPEGHPPVTELKENDWSYAAELIFPIFRPVGSQGLPITELDPDALAVAAGRGHAQPLIDDGPCGIPLVFALHESGFDIMVNADHVLTWGIGPNEVRDTALRNLAAWSKTAPWTDEVSGDRRLVSSDSGDGWDAVRILLPDVREHLTRELSATGRVLIGLPERHLLIAGTLSPSDVEFAALFADFVVEQSGGADEPVDRRVFELVDGELVEFAGVGELAG